VYDLRVVVDEVRGFCDLPMQVGDYFEVRRGKIIIPDGKYVCLWALQSIMPILPLKERNITEENDWVPNTDKITCPDPAGMVIYRIIPLGKEQSNEKDRILVNPESCNGCGTCEQLCREKHPDKVSRIRVGRFNGQNMPTICRQCGSAPCVHACSHNALKRDPRTKAVIILEERCKSCGDCIQSCPFSAMNLDSGTGKPLVCDLCGGDPVCVKNCPTGAIVFGRGNKNSR